MFISVDMLINEWMNSLVHSLIKFFFVLGLGIKYGKMTTDKSLPHKVYILGRDTATEQVNK